MNILKKSFLDKFLIKWRTKKVKNLIKGGVVCDLGCGDGEFLLEISKKIKKGYGFDKKTKSRKIGNILIKKITKKKIPLKKECADYVTLIAVIEHLEKPEEIIMECKRILKKNGLLIITTPLPRSRVVLGIMTKLNLLGWGGEEVKDHKRYFDNKSMNYLLNKEGFKILKYETFELGFNSLIMASKK